MHILVYGFSGKILGGIETFILNMNEHMSPDCVFDYIIDGDECVYRERIEARGGKVFFVPGIKKSPIKYIKAFKSILREQKKSGTNILYVQLFSMANMLPSFLAKHQGYKVILHAHNNGLQNKNGLYNLIHLLGKHIAHNGDYIRFTNSSLSSDFMFGKGVRSELIYNAISTEKFSFHQSNRDKVRTEQGCGNNTVIGFVGRLMLQKNPVFMVQIFAEILELKPNCELWIVGEGELKEAMLNKIEEQGIKKSVKWLGRRNDVEQLMQGMDLLLQPSLFEGLGIVLIEAQATGLPVLTSADVIPKEANVSVLFNEESLSSSPTQWAYNALSILSRDMARDKQTYLLSSNFDINIEAQRLESLLVSYN